PHSGDLQPYRPSRSLVQSFRHRHAARMTLGRVRNWFRRLAAVAAADAVDDGAALPAARDDAPSAPARPRASGSRPARSRTRANAATSAPAGTIITRDQHTVS